MQFAYTTMLRAVNAFQNNRLAGQCMLKIVSIITIKNLFEETRSKIISDNRTLRG